MVGIYSQSLKYIIPSYSDLFAFLVTYTLQCGFLLCVFAILTMMWYRQHRRIPSCIWLFNTLECDNWVKWIRWHSLTFISSPLQGILEICLLSIRLCSCTFLLYWKSYKIFPQIYSPALYYIFCFISVSDSCHCDNFPL